VASSDVARREALEAKWAADRSSVLAMPEGSAKVAALTAHRAAHAAAKAVLEAAIKAASTSKSEGGEQGRRA